MKRKSRPLTPEGKAFALLLELDMAPELAESIQKVSFQVGYQAGFLAGAQFATDNIDDSGQLVIDLSEVSA